MRFPRLSLFGFRFKIHPTLLLFFFLSAALGLGFQAVVLLASVVLHEFGHVLVAERLGFSIQSIELFPFGGLARLRNYMGTSPEKEARVAVSGPMVNILLITLLLLARPLVVDVDRELAAVIELAIKANLVILVFNLLPALPLDGGRIYRAYLAVRIGFKPATERAVLLGKVLSGIIFLAGVLLLLTGGFNITVLLMAAVLYHGALAEQRMSSYAFMAYLAHKRRELAKAGILPMCGFAVRGSTQIKQVLYEIKPENHHIITVIADDGSLGRIYSEGEVIDAVLSGRRSLFDRIGEL